VEPLCSVCRKILSIIHGEYHDYYVYLGHPVDLLWSKCEFHPRLIAHLLNGYVADSAVTISGHNVYVKTGDSPACLQLWHRRSYAAFYELMEYTHLGKSYGFARSIDQDWVDLEQLKTWAQYCREAHGESCHLPNGLSEKFSTRPDLLIDTLEMRLRKVEGNENYATLSYVWGDAPTLKPQLTT
jgi:hypothetical protein